MPRGPQGQKRPRDPNQLGKLIVDISVGEVDDQSQKRKPSAGKPPAVKPAKPIGDS